MELFQNIIRDLFPSVTVPSQDHGVLEKAVHDVLLERGLQCPEAYVTKVRRITIKGYVIDIMRVHVPRVLL